MRPRENSAGSSNRSFDRQLRIDAAILILPSIVALALVLMFYDFGAWLTVPVAALSIVATALLLSRLTRRVTYALGTLANLVESLRAGDYSLRGSNAMPGDSMGEVIIEINTLSKQLRDQRLEGEEARALLAKMIEAIDIALLTFDDAGRLTLTNPAAERLLGESLMVGESAETIGLADCLLGETVAVATRRFAGGDGRYEIRRFAFRAGGRAQTLLVISDLSRALRDEERAAWHRLIRVLGHELNNSLAPIRSMTGTLMHLASLDPLPDDWREDVTIGLRIIGDRTESLNRFMLGYTALARLPAPSLRPVDLVKLLQRTTLLERRVSVTLSTHPSVIITIDPDQIEQAIINLLQNAAESAINGGGHVSVAIALGSDSVEVSILDDGLGLAETDNLFVPFFTTKPGGSGIGLALSRQIAEAHGGTVSLSNRSDRRGCVATLRIPWRIEKDQAGLPLRQNAAASLGKE